MRNKSAISGAGGSAVEKEQDGEDIFLPILPSVGSGNEQSRAHGGFMRASGRGIYMWENRRRDRQYGRVEDSMVDEAKWAGLTDKQNTKFRYVY
ncbi:hypothetical protein BO71DRAFT_434284 [Aspergillus ellipticus CBS 707.79]|uniref:Uncharacterized protein n=1 Tax=Aspergillus ellipticus CBS 707.79 TaxID=1448320 RepID=A0A319DPK0_9EURO|nr:hypothetical protein BO71DRAFT_434284 [Aspergillus ellipticus CBS 707.79]